jgi:hypothetical protein
MTNILPLENPLASRFHWTIPPASGFHWTIGSGKTLIRLTQKIVLRTDVIFSEAVFFIKLPGNKILIEMSSLLRQKKALV